MADDAPVTVPFPGGNKPFPQGTASPVPDGPAELSLYNLDPTAANYLGFGLTISYHRDHGYAGQVPAAAYGSALTDIVRLNTGRCVKTVTGCALRIGQVPAVPDPRPQGPNEVLAFDQYSFFQQVMPDGQVAIGAVWAFGYILQAMPVLGVDFFDVGGSALSLMPAEVARLDPSQFTRFLTPPAAVTFPGGISAVDY